MCTHSIILFNNIHKGLFHGKQKTWAQTIHSWCIERTSRDVALVALASVLAAVQAYG